MRIQAVCEHGIVRLPDSLGRRLRRVEVVVEIPDAAIDDGSSVLNEVKLARSGSVGRDLDAILGKYREHNQSVSPEEDKQRWHEHLFRKHVK
ncbi:MAG: hypothetical protein D6694_10220 [Gammaproteobacteria bacterium]|nr:MAG: hypothetical protein D6694_10220 [Gammaproteobacteria bacterium]